MYFTERPNKYELKDLGELVEITFFSNVRQAGAGYICDVFGLAIPNAENIEQIIESDIQQWVSQAKLIKHEKPVQTQIIIAQTELMDPTTIASKLANRLLMLDKDNLSIKTVNKTAVWTLLEGIKPGMIEISEFVPLMQNPNIDFRNLVLWMPVQASVLKEPTPAEFPYSEGALVKDYFPCHETSGKLAIIETRLQRSGNPYPLDEDLPDKKLFSLFYQFFAPRLIYEPLTPEGKDAWVAECFSQPG